jgi:elongation factor P
MISTADFKKGCQILVDGEPFTVLDYSVHSPSARGAATLVRTRIRNVLTGAVFERTFKAGDKFDEPDVEERDAQYLYSSGDEFHFLDQVTFEQFALAAELLGDAVRFLAENTIVRSLIYNDAVVNVSLPQFVELKVEETELATRGDTAAGKVMKDARLSTGAIVKVPLYLQAGERILVDTSTGEFVKRVR